MKRIVYILMLIISSTSAHQKNDAQPSLYEKYNKFVPAAVIGTCAAISLTLPKKSYYYRDNRDYTPVMILNLFGGVTAALYREEQELIKAKKAGTTPDLDKIRTTQAAYVGVGLLIGILTSMKK